MKDGGQQIWSVVFLCAPIALLAVFMIAAVACLFAQTSTTGYVAGTGTNPSAAAAPGMSVTGTNLDTCRPIFSGTDLQVAVAIPRLTSTNYFISCSGRATWLRHLYKK